MQIENLSHRSRNLFNYCCCASFFFW